VILCFNEAALVALPTPAALQIAAAQLHGTLALFSLRLALARDRGDSAEVQRLLAEARSSGFQTRRQDIERHARNLSMPAPLRRERRTPTLIRQQCLEYFDMTGGWELQ
jgi:hypothetical protein